MNDLTEQWKKGKIPQAWYYVKDIHNKESLDRYFKETDNFEYLEDWEVEEVLAEVPDYVEWRNMVNCACEEHEANKRLLEENKQLKERVSKLEKMQYSYTPEEWNTMLRTVNRTKELLKECKEIFDECFSPSAKHGELYKKIDEALK